MAEAGPAKQARDAVPATTIEVDAPCVTMINVFEVSAERQAELVALLERATIEVMRDQPGFISANIHRGIDGTHVANYAQWRTAEDFQRMLANPQAQSHMRAALEMASASPVLYRVSSVHR